MHSTRDLCGSEQGGNGIPDEQLPIADVPREHRVTGVAGLGADLDRRDPGLGRAAGEAGAERVTGVPGGV